MDPRQSLSRTASASIPQSPYSNPNMTSAYAGSMPPAYGQGHSLPPISSQYPAPPHHPTAGQPYQMPQAQFRDQRYAQNPSPASTPDRFGQQMAPQQGMNNMPQGGMLPQPQAQPPQQSPYTTQAGSRPNIYPQPLAPAPPRTNMDPYGSYGQPGGDRQWSGPEQIPGMTTDIGRDPTRTHVVGSQGRRGILPSAPGRPPVMPNGLNGSSKGPAIPQKDADGKFPCPNCTKTYLHAKHLKRHMLRHTGDRPYMCVLCNDTFSRSDILKRHFQKCSVRRGNPTGASHLSNPAAHLKKSQAAAAKAAAAAAAANASQQSKSQTGTGTPTSSTPVQQSPYAAMSSAGSSMPATTASLPAMTTMPFANGQSDMHRTAGPQGMQNPGQNGMDQNGNANWNMQNARTNQMMYNSNNASPAQGGPHVSGNDSWNQFLPAHDGGEYNMSQMYGYDHNQTETKTEAHEGGSNNYYMPSTSLGADGMQHTSSAPQMLPIAAMRR